MAGVLPICRRGKEALDVRVDNNVLTIRGQARMPCRVMSSIGKRLVTFQAVELHEKVDQQRITAI